MCCVPLTASTITRQIDERAEDIEAQLLERINESPWCAIRVDESADVNNKVTMLVLCDTFFRRLCVGIRYVHFCCKQHHSCRTIHAFELLRINDQFRKTELVILSV